MLVAVIGRGGGVNAYFSDYYGIFPQRDDGDCGMDDMHILAQHMGVLRSNQPNQHVMKAQWVAQHLQGTYFGGGSQ